MRISTRITVTRVRRKKFSGTRKVVRAIRMGISTRITVSKVRGKASSAGKKDFQQKVALPNHKVARFLKKFYNFVPEN